MNGDALGYGAGHASQFFVKVLHYSLGHCTQFTRTKYKRGFDGPSAAISQASGEERANNVCLKPPLWHLKVVSRAFQEDELAGLHGTPQSQHLIPTHCSV